MDFLYIFEGGMKQRLELLLPFFNGTRLIYLEMVTGVCILWLATIVLQRLILHWCELKGRQEPDDGIGQDGIFWIFLCCFENVLDLIFKSCAVLEYGVHIYLYSWHFKT